MQRPLPLMFIVSMLAASVGFAGQPSQGSRYQPNMGARSDRDAHRQQPTDSRRPGFAAAQAPRYAARGNGRDYGYAESRYPRSGFGDDGRYGRQDYRNTSWNGDRHDWRDERDHEWHHDRDWYDHYRGDHYRFYGNRYYARQRFAIGYYSAPWGYTTRWWACGDRLPRSYYGARYVVGDYYNYGLYAPSYATAWIRVGNDVLLIDMGNGQVLDVVGDLFW